MLTVFVDRDGVINRDSDAYIKTADEFEFLSGSLEALTLLKKHAANVFVVTNQSMIGRKLSTLTALEGIFSTMRIEVERFGGKINDIFYCPHTPDDQCECRKPLPGMILRAQQKYNINLDKSCMIGDSAKDIECGKNAGCALTILVRTGNGIQAEKSLLANEIHPDYIAEDLLDAVKWLLQNTP